MVKDMSFAESGESYLFSLQVSLFKLIEKKIRGNRNNMKTISLRVSTLVQKKNLRFCMWNPLSLIEAVFKSVIVK